MSTTTPFYYYLCDIQNKALLPKKSKAFTAKTNIMFKNIQRGDNRLDAHLALLVANILFALNVPNVKYILSSADNFPALALNFTRISVGALLFWFISLFLPKEKVPAKDLFMIALASLFGVQFNQLCFILASPFTSPVDISIIATLIPILTMCLSALILKEPITWKKVLGVVCGGCGALIIILGTKANSVSASNPLLGNMLFFLSTLIFSCYLTIFKPLILRYSPVTFMKWMFLFATICQTPICIKDVLSVDPTALSSEVIWCLVYASVGASFISYVLLARGQQLLRPTIVSMYNYLQPFIVFTAAWILGQDSFDVKKILATGLIFVGVYIVTQSKSRKDMSV